MPISLASKSIIRHRHWQGVPITLPIILSPILILRAVQRPVILQVVHQRQDNANITATVRHIVSAAPAEIVCRTGKEPAPRERNVAAVIAERTGLVWQTAEIMPMTAITNVTAVVQRAAHIVILLITVKTVFVYQAVILRWQMPLPEIAAVPEVLI